MRKNRWIALAIIFLSFLQMTLNWFAIVPAFGPIAGELHLGLAGIGLMVSAFIAGYGLAHIPGGFLAEWIGVRGAMLTGIALETIGAALSARAPGFETLLLARFIAGVGGSIYIGAAIGLTTAWFREHELVTATGTIAGVAFALGAAIGLYVWGPIVVAYGWRNALMWGAAVGLVTFFGLLAAYPVPPSPKLRTAEEGQHLSMVSLKRVFGNRDLWLMGVSFLGGYGAYFTGAQLLPDYVTKALHVTPEEAGLIGAIYLLAGIPGSFLGGWLADKVIGVIPTSFGACSCVAITWIVLPFLDLGGIYVAAAIIGGVSILGFVSWVSLPGLSTDKLQLSDIPTAVGLMFTIVAIGGVLVPGFYGRLSESYGFATGWVAMGLLCFIPSLLCFAVRHP